jgi:hypothetical protein
LLAPRMANVCDVYTSTRRSALTKSNIRTHSSRFLPPALCLCPWRQ